MTAGRGFLGLPTRTVVAWATVTAVIGGAIGLALPTPLERHAPCGVVAEVEDGVTTYLPASCIGQDEMAERLAAIRAERPSGRFGGR